MIVLTFRGRTLEVSGKAIKTFQEMGITREAKVKEQEGDAGDGKPKAGYAKVEGIKADSISFEVLLLQAAGVDVQDEIQGWRALVDGQSARIYIAGADVLNTDVTLTNCEASQVMLDGAGNFSQAKLKLTFLQAEAEKKTGTGGSAGSHSKYHTYVEAWAINATTKKKMRISTVKGGTRAAGETWKQPTAPTGYIAPTEYRAKQYAKKDCPFCKALEQQKAALAAAAGKNQTGFVSVYTPKPTE